MNGQDAAQGRMAARIATLTTRQLVAVWHTTVDRWAASPAGELHDSMLAIEGELRGRGEPSCLHCCGPSGQHVPGLCETMRAVGV